MRTCRRSLLPSDASPARDTLHTHARAHAHVLTKCPWQSHADEDGHAGAWHHRALHQQSLQPEAERLQLFLNNVRVKTMVPFSEHADGSQPAA